jgi:hypothetical protein
MQTNK